MSSMFLSGLDHRWTFLPIMAFGALLGIWCVNFAIRYSLSLLSGQSRAPRNPVLIRWGVGLLMAACSLVFLARHGLSLTGLGLVAAAAVLLVLALVDAQTLLLPDALTLPLIWLGVALAWMRGPVSLHDSVAGVMAGYGFLWLLFWLYTYVRKRQGMGYGDFKLLAALGAWVGWAALPWVLLVACLAGLAYACARRKKLNVNDAYPFGPFLAASGVGVLLLGPEVHSYF